MKDDLIHQKVESTMSSLDNLTGADPGEFFAAKTVQKMKNQRGADQPISLFWKIAVAVLVLVNVGSMTLSNQSDEVTLSSDAVSELSDEYFSFDLGINDIEITL